MRTFVSIRHQLSTTQYISTELEAVKAKLELLERNDEDNLEAINDLSEDMRREIDAPEPLRQKIGFKTSSDKKDDA